MLVWAGPAKALGYPRRAAAKSRLVAPGILFGDFDHGFERARLNKFAGGGLWRLGVIAPCLHLDTFARVLVAVTGLFHLN